MLTDFLFLRNEGVGSSPALNQNGPFLVFLALCNFLNFSNQSSFSEAFHKHRRKPYMFSAIRFTEDFKIIPKILNMENFLQVNFSPSPEADLLDFFWSCGTVGRRDLCALRLRKIIHLFRRVASSSSFESLKLFDTETFLQRKKTREKCVFKKLFHDVYS